MSSDPLDRLDLYAATVKGHVTLHGVFGPEAIRHPGADWTCQLVWSTGQPSEPVLAFFGTGASREAAAAHVLTQIDERLAQLDDPQEPA